MLWYGSPVLLRSRSVGAHHLVVLVIEDVTVPDVARPFGRIKGELVLPRGDAIDGHLGGGPADGDAGGLPGEHLEGVLPACLVGVGWDGAARQEGGHIRVAPDSSAGVGLVVVFGRSIPLDERPWRIGD